MGFSAQSQNMVRVRKESKQDADETSHWCTTAGSRFSTRPGVRNLRLAPDFGLTREEPQLFHVENKENELDTSFSICSSQARSINIA